MTTAHRLLGLPPDADPDQVRAAYRRAVRATHPDLGGDAAAFRAVQAAYDQLTAPSPAADLPAADRRVAADGPSVEPLAGAPVGAWRRGYETRPVQAIVGAIIMVLQAGTLGSVVGVVLGLWAAIVLVPLAGLLWAAATAATAWRHRGQPRPTELRGAWRRRLVHAVVAVVCVPVAYLVTYISVATLWLLVKLTLGAYRLASQLT